MSTTRPIRFLLNDIPVSVTDVDPTTNLLTWLRTCRGLVGSKEGCAEGDCGACTVVVGELHADGVQLRSRNACIQFVPALDGKAVYTVEALRSPEGCLHPVQQAMVDCHGSQCGFCTPGFVMSLWDLYNAHIARGSRADRSQVQSALTGNLCRCTGYRPILDAGQAMFDHPPVIFDQAALATRLRALADDPCARESLHYRAGDVSFHAPRSLTELLRLRAEKPAATLLAGCTDIGLWVNKQFRPLGDIIYLGQVAELHALNRADDMITVGAAVSLTDAYAALCEDYPELHEMWERFASTPIRNAGTLGGNVANGSPIGDSTPGLIALGARVRLVSVRGERELPLDQFYLAYMKKDLQADEVVSAVCVPRPAPDAVFRTYKVSKRFDSDISAVCAAFRLELDGATIRSARVAYGGMAATPQRATAAEAALAGETWSEATARRAMAALAQDYTPLADMRASADYRMQTAQNLLYRCYLETRPEAPLSAAKTRVFADFTGASV